MSLLISLIVVLLVAGLVLYIIRLLVPALGLPTIIVPIATAIILVLVVIWLLQLLPGIDLGTTLHLDD
jgi:hypothetical protein